MLADMFDVEPFDPQAAAKLPSGFAWSPDAPTARPSSFSVAPKAVESIDRRIANRIADGRLWGALQINDALYPDWYRKDNEDEVWTSHGIVLAQQRESGQVWMLVAGLSGPDTWAAAVALADGETGAVPQAGGADSSIRWDVVESTVARQSGLPGDDREVQAHRVVAHGMFPPIE